MFRGGTLDTFRSKNTVTGSSTRRAALDGATVCAAHHLHGLHDGTVRASGVAPHAIEWQLGVRPGAPPFLTYVRDRLCSPDDTSAIAMNPLRDKLSFVGQPFRTLACELPFGTGAAREPW